MSRHTLLIVTSSSCGNCITFMQKHEASTMEMLNNRGDLNIIRIHDGQVVSNTTRLNKNISKYIAYVPAFMLVTQESWDSDDEPNLVIMNQVPGRYSQGRFIPTDRGKGEFPSNAEGVNNWLNRELNNNPMFNKNVPQAPRSISASPYEIVPLKTPTPNKYAGKYKYDSSSSDSD